VLRVEDISNLSTVLTKGYRGASCSDYEMFIRNNVVGQPFYSYLLYADTQIHGNVHYSVSGAGGDFTAVIDDILRSQYNLTDQDFVSLSYSTSAWMKTYLASGSSLDIMNCDKFPWNATIETLENDLPPGFGGPRCGIHEELLRDNDKLDDLIKLYFKMTIKVPYLNVRDTLLNYKDYGLSYEQKQEMVRLIFSRMQFDGDMSGSGSATDPLFWIAHGAIERLFQRTLFEDVLTDKVYLTDETSTSSNCSGHAAWGKLQWLKGYKFEDKTVNPEELTNAELIRVLDPTDEFYEHYIPFIYESKDFDWCDGFDEWFRADTQTMVNKLTEAERISGM
jgi:hypothetical protein